MGAVMQFMPETAAKGYAANIGNPLLGIEAELKRQSLRQGEVDVQTAEIAGQEARFKLSENRSATRTTLTNLRTASKAFDRLKTIPGADAILVNPLIAQWMRTGVSGSKLTNKIAELAGSGVFDIDPKDLPDALSAVELISKARFNVGSNTSTAVQGQANAMKGLGEGVGLDEQQFVFNEQLEETKRQMQENEWNLPDEPSYPFYRNVKKEEPSEPKVGYTPGAGAAAAPTAPLPTPVATTDIPAASEADTMLPAWMTGAPEAVATTATDLYNKAAPVVQQGAEAATKAGKDALATAQAAGAEASKIVKRVGKIGLNAAGIPVYARWEDAARAVKAGELDEFTGGYIIVDGKIVDVR
jgi:hypothetical protein